MLSTKRILTINGKKKKLYLFIYVYSKTYVLSTICFAARLRPSTDRHCFPGDFRFAPRPDRKRAAKGTKRISPLPLPQRRRVYNTYVRRVYTRWKQDVITFTRLCRSFSAWCFLSRIVFHDDTHPPEPAAILNTVRAPPSFPTERGYKISFSPPDDDRSRAYNDVTPSGKPTPTSSRRVETIFWLRDRQKYDSNLVYRKMCFEVNFYHSFKRIQVDP